jgi:prepilin-type processing-associated H-X9-DG protein
MRQIGIAAHTYHSLNNAFPAGEHNTGHLLSCWLTDLLPYIEQENLWDTTQSAYAQSAWPFNIPPHVGLTTLMPIYECPADPRASQLGFAQRDRFEVAFTSYLGVEGQDLYSHDGIFYSGSHVRIEDISDGTSETLLAGERPPSTDDQFGWWYAGAGQAFTGSLDSTLGVREIDVLPFGQAACLPGPYQFGPGYPSNQCDMFHFWSLHPGGANFLFADGAVHFLGYDAAPLLPALASRSGGEGVEVP